MNNSTHIIGVVLLSFLSIAIGCQADASGETGGRLSEAPDPREESIIAADCSLANLADFHHGMTRDDYYIALVPEFETVRTETVTTDDAELGRTVQEDIAHISFSEDTRFISRRGDRLENATVVVDGSLRIRIAADGQIFQAVECPEASGVNDSGGLSTRIMAEQGGPVALLIATWPGHRQVAGAVAWDGVRLTDGRTTVSVDELMDAAAAPVEPANEPDESLPDER